MKQFAGYDPLSPTLQPSPMAGDCMRGIIPDEFRTAWVDRAVPVASGDLVRLTMRYPDGVTTRIIKQLRYTRDDRWWGFCADGVFEIGITGKPRTIAQPHAIEKVVALDEQEFSRPPRNDKIADPDLAAYYAQLAADAVREWETHGYPRGIAFPGLAPDGLAP